MSQPAVYSLDDLRAIEHQQLAGFCVQMPDLAQTLYQCEKVLRLLSGRRVVMKARAPSGELVALKVFYREKDYRREVQGCEYLASAEIPAPRLLDKLEPGDQIYVLVYEWLDGLSVQQLFTSKEKGSFREHMIKACELVAQMHEKGIVQEDIHLDNFFVVAGDVSALDAGGIKQVGESLGKKALENFALMLAQLPVAHDKDIPTYFDAYVSHMREVTFDLETLIQQVKMMRAKRWRHYLGKLQRECSEFIFLQDWRQMQVCRRDQASDGLTQLLKDPDAYITRGRLLKKGNTSTVALVDIDGVPYVIKRYNIKNFKHLLSRFWRPSRAWCSWINAYRLKFDALPTPCPIAVKEERWGPFRSKAYLVCEYVQGVDLLEFCSSSSMASDKAGQIESSIRDVFEGFWELGVSHGDMKATNLLVTDDGIQIIDLDAMVLHKSKSALKKGLDKDIARFLRNWGDGQRSKFERLLEPLMKKIAA